MNKKTVTKAGVFTAAQEEAIRKIAIEAFTSMSLPVATLPEAVNVVLETNQFGGVALVAVENFRSAMQVKYQKDSQILQALDEIPRFYTWIGQPGIKEEHEVQIYKNSGEKDGFIGALFSDTDRFWVQYDLHEGGSKREVPSMVAMYQPITHRNPVNYSPEEILSIVVAAFENRVKKIEDSRKNVGGPGFSPGG